MISKTKIYFKVNTFWRRIFLKKSAMYFAWRHHKLFQILGWFFKHSYIDKDANKINILDSICLTGKTRSKIV